MVPRLLNQRQLGVRDELLQRAHLVLDGCRRVLGLQAQGGNAVASSASSHEMDAAPRLHRQVPCRKLLH